MVLIVWGLIGVLFYIFRDPSDSFKDPTASKLMPILGGIWILTSSVVFTIVLIGLAIYVGKILKRLMVIDMSEKNAAEIARHMLSVRITKLLLSFSFLILISQIFIIVNGIEYIFGNDMLTIQFHFVFNIFLNMWVGVVEVAFCILFVDWGAIKAAYPCCTKRKRTFI
jgi:hypothetical protein